MTSPYLLSSVDSFVQSMKDKRVNRAYKSAYMGDPGAMEDLAGQSPELAMKLQADLQRRKNASAQQGLAKQADQVKRREVFKKASRQVMEDLSKFSTYAEAKQYGQRAKSNLAKYFPEVSKNAGFTPEFTEQDFNEAKTIHGKAPEEAGGAFAGSGMPAQVSSALVKGANDPEYRKTPEYARAWDIANKPDIIDTEEGRIPLYPKIDPMFKAPGDTKPVQQEVAEIRAVSQQDSKVIKGTEKTKTTADEKISYGYYNRMLGAEENIKKLGEFDSASVWERFKGLTNITSSPELQQYRQAADDWIRAKLRRESGAVIADSEMAKEYEIYFPRIGDSQEVIDQKRGAREEAERSMKTASGREHKKGDSGKAQQPVLSESDLSVTIDGKKSVFPNVESYNAYKKAIGQ